MQADGNQAGVDTLHQRERIAAFAIFATMAMLIPVMIGQLFELAGVIDLAAAPGATLAVAYTAIL